MLTRTRADQVVPVYEKFFARFPSFEKLKSADPQEAYVIFASLGLNWRAKRIVELIKALSELGGKILRVISTACGGPMEAPLASA